MAYHFSEPHLATGCNRRLQQIYAFWLHHQHQPTGGTRGQQYGQSFQQRMDQPTDLSGSQQRFCSHRERTEPTIVVRGTIQDGINNLYQNISCTRG